MAHGHSHGGGGHSHSAKTKKTKRKDETTLEAGDNEHLCAEESRGHAHDATDHHHHGHSHDLTPAHTGYSRVNSDASEDAGLESSEPKNEKKHGRENTFHTYE
jgi:solute carrier family 30 (zinc transporter), member 1